MITSVFMQFFTQVYPRFAIFMDVCAHCPQLVQPGFEPYCCHRCGIEPGHHGPWCHHRYPPPPIGEPINCRSCGAKLRSDKNRTPWCRPCWLLWLAKSREAQSPLKPPVQGASDECHSTAVCCDGLPSPVFVVGLPECGTTSLQHALESVGYGSIHCYAPKPWGPLPGDRFVGQLIDEAVAAGLEPLALLPPWVNAITQLDCWWIEGDCPESEQCYAHFRRLRC